MAVTYVPAATRDDRRVRARELTFGPLLVLTVSAAAIFVLGAAYAGRTATAASLGRSSINLNTVADPAPLEAALAPAFEHGGDRVFAARELFGFLVQGDGGRRVLPNVGLGT